MCVTVVVATVYVTRRCHKGAAQRQEWHEYPRATLSWLALAEFPAIVFQLSLIGSEKPLLTGLLSVQIILVVAWLAVHCLAFRSIFYALKNDMQFR
jgi:uncharacterized membrane protein YjgN (DUF898 family)